MAKFFLSTYIHVDPLAHIENMYFRHDQNMSLWRLDKNKLDLVHYWELERETGKKEHFRSFYDKEHFALVANRLLKQYGLTIDDMEEIIGSPGISTCTKEEFGSYLDYPELEYHSIAHLFSALLSNTEDFRSEKIISLSLDGGPDRTLDVRQDLNYYCGAYSENGDIKEIFPVSSPALLWTAAYTMFGLKEGTLMALATACESEAKPLQFPKFTIKNMEDIKSSTAPMKKYMTQLRDAVWSLDLHDETKMKAPFDARFTEEENYISIAMKEIIRFSISITEDNIDQIIKRFQLNASDCCLSMSGGFALNCPINSYLIKKYGFKKFITLPCVNDSGISLGYALYYFYKQNPDIQFRLGHAFYGDEDKSLPEVWIKGKYSDVVSSLTELDYDIVVEDIIQHPIVWFSGRAEIGPRALGGRSLIADPRMEETKDVLNRIKQRQWWRPVAPIALLEEAEEWFDEADESPFMLRTFTIKESKKHLIPSIAHMDDSARLQTVTLDENPALYWLLKAFKKKTGIPILCNTSLNGRGEPIINRIPEALDFAVNKQIPVVYINQHRLEMKVTGSELQTLRSHNRLFDYDNYLSQKEQQRLKGVYNPHGLTEEQLNLYCFSDLKDTLDLTDAKHAEMIRRLHASTENKYFWEIEKH